MYILIYHIYYKIKKKKLFLQNFNIYFFKLKFLL